MTPSRNRPKNSDGKINPSPFPTEDFQHRLGMNAEDFQHKLDIVVEGHQLLGDKIDRVEANLSRRIDAVATEVAAHRADTEAHQGVYRVKEE